MTGRRAGFCSGSGGPGYTNGGGGGGYQRFSGGRGAGMGRKAGSGYGRGYGVYPPSEIRADERKPEHGDLEQELTVLKNKLKVLEQRLSKKDDEA